MNISVDGISASAYISNRANLGRDVKVGANAYIGDYVDVGDNVKIGNNAYIEKNTKIGSGCVVFPGAVIGTDPQDLKYKQEETFVEIGCDTIIREFVTINRGTTENYKTVVGNNCLLLAYAHVAHDCVVGNHVIMSNNASLAGHCIVGEHAVLSGFAIAHQFSRIGAYAFVQGGGKIIKDIPPFSLCGGEPLRFVGINSEKLKRLNFSQEDISAIKNSYKMFYDPESVSLVDEIVDKILSQYPSNTYAKEIVAFFEASKRGVITKDKK